MNLQILSRVAAGEQNAVEDCMDAYGKLVWALARKLSPTTEDAEDAVQEIFIDVWKHASRFDESIASESTFIATIARRRLIDRLRKSTRAPKADSIDDMIYAPSTNQHKQMQTGVEAKQASVAMKQLRPEQQKVLQMSIFDGYSHYEIAEVTGLPVGTVKTHARRGIAKMREFLGVEVSQTRMAYAA